MRIAVGIEVDCVYIIQVKMETGGVSKVEKGMAGRRPGGTANPSGRRPGTNPLAGLGRFYGLKPKAAIRRFFENWRDFEKDKPEPTFEPLQVKRFDNNKNRNAFEHHTDDLAEESYFAIRRGQPFYFDLELNRAYQPETDDIIVVLQFGSEPSLKEGTDIDLHLKNTKKYLDWDAEIESNKDNVLKVKVTPPPDCYIGKWSLMIDSIIPVTRDDKKIRVRENIHTYKDKIYMLFNAWCKEDDVYLEDDAKRQEYVLNETGAIYVGAGWWPSKRSWLFGQFEKEVLEVAMILLRDYAYMRDRDMGDVMKITRQISAVVNSQDDYGVLSGNWSGDYEGGTSPLNWTGSVEILKEFYEKRESVRYGQCWVFSGVVTTLCRALGIPTRSVTNFDSAHDTDGSVTIDTVYDEDGEEVEHLSSDSVWNFHVWNDCWMKRPDLPDGYDGWQAIDATPQELSGGTYCMGPASLKAIREGNICLQYDAPFAFAEVNGDKVDWLMRKDGSLSITKVKTNGIGTRISTKAVGLDERDDITDEYKHQEWGKKNKAAVARANRFGKMAEYFDDGGPKDVQLDFVLPEKKTYVGEDFEWNIKLVNTSDEVRTLKGRVNISSSFYTGLPCKKIMTVPVEALVLKPKEEKFFGKIITASVYFKFLTDHCQISVGCSMNVKETKQSLADKMTADLTKPMLQINAPRECTVSDSTEVDVYFTNPLDTPLHHCELRVMGPGFKNANVIEQKDVPAKAKFTSKFKMTPFKAGNKEVVVNFNCDELMGINNSRGILVKKLEDK